MPNAAYEVLFTTNASKVEGEIKSLHQQVGKAIVPTVDLSNLKALNAELDLKQRHLRQTIAYFKQNQIKASMELSMPALTPAALQKALPSTEIKKVAQQQAKQFENAFQSAVGQPGVIDVQVKDLGPAGIEVVKARLVEISKSARLRKAELTELVSLAGRKGVDVSGLAGISKPTNEQLRQTLAKGFSDAGDQAIVGLANALAAGNTTAAKAAERLGKETLRELRKVLKIQSPSKETEADGRDIVDGLAIGINRHSDKAITAARNLAKEVAAAMDPANIPQGRRRQAANAAMRTPDLSASWFTAPAPPRKVPDPWGPAQPSPQEREAQMRAQLKAIGIVHLEQKVLDDLAQSYKQVAKAKTEGAMVSDKTVTRLLPAAGQTAASRMAFSDLTAGGRFNAPDISKLKAEVKAVEAQNRSLLELGDRLAGVTMRPGHYRRAIRQAGIENLPLDITGLANERALKGFEVGIGRFVKKLPEAMQQSIRNQLGTNSKLFIPVETLVRQLTGQKGQLERSLDDALKPSGKTLANNGEEAGKDFSERLADGITSGASKAVAAAKKVAAQVSAAMRGGGGGGGGGAGLGGSAPSGPNPSNLRALSGQTLGSFKRRQHVGGNQFVIEDIVGLYEQLAAVERKINRVPINSNAFKRLSSNAGFRQGEIERAQNISQVQRLRASGQFFEEGSLTRLSKQLQALQIEASQIKPETDEWKKYQKEITKTTLEMEKLARTSRELELTVRESTAEKGSIASLRAQLERRQMNLEFLAPGLADFTKTTKEMQRLERQMDRISRKPTPMGDRLGAAAGAVLYGGGLAGSPLSALGGIAGGLTGGIAGSFTGAAIGQTADQLVAATSAVANQYSELLKLQRGLAMASIESKDFREAQDAIAASSKKLFMPLQQTTKFFTQLRANTVELGMSVADTQQIFEGTALAVAATGGSIEDVEGAMRATVQILSKGGVQAEELRGQLGERFPGAVVKFAKANKMSFQELQDALQAGTVGIDQFVKFAKQNYTDYANFAKALETAPEYAGQRMTKAMESFSLALGEIVLGPGAQLQDTFTTIIDGFTAFLRDNKEDLREFARNVASIVSDLTSLSKIMFFIPAGIVKGLGAASRFVKGQQGIDTAEPKTPYVFGGPRDNIGPGGMSEESLKKLRESYDSILKRQRDLTREIDDETFRRRADNARKEVEIYRARQQLDIDAADYRYRKLIDGEDGAKAEMMSALADYIRTRDEATANNQAKQRSFQVSLLEMQKEMERVRLNTWEKIQEIAKAIGKYQIDVMNAQIKAMRGNLSDVTGATAPYGPTQTQGMVARTGNTGDSTGAHLDIRWGDGRPITAAQADRYFRVKGEPPSKYGVTSQYGPRNLFGRSFHGGIDFGTPAGSPITLTGGARFSKNLGNTGAGGYVIEVMTPEGTMKALHLMANSAIQSVPVRPQGAATAALQAPAGSMAMQVDGAPQAGLAQAPQMLPTTFSVDTRELERQINRSRDLEASINELSRLGDLQKTQEAFDAVAKRTFPRLKLNDLRTEVATQRQVLRLTQTTSDEELSAIRAQAKARDENTRKQLYDIKTGAGLELFYQKLSSAEREKLAKAAEKAATQALQDSARQAQLQEELVMIERDRSSLKDKTSLQDQLGLFALSVGVERETKRLQIERNISEEMARSLATLQSQITFSQELEQIRAQQKLAVTAPGMETMVQEYVNQGYSMEQARMAAMEKAQAERLTSMKQAFVSLGESINTTLGSTIVNVATDWGNFTKNVQDSVKTLQDAFKQLANAIINEMTRALVSKAVGWLMNASGIAPMTEAQGGEGVKKFANGGIVTGPTLGLIGEGRYNEAIIPMPNNRAVPVDLRGSVGSTYNSPINVVINNSSTGTTAESQITGDQGNKLAGVLDKAVKQAILNEQRPGGALYRQ